MSLGLVESFCGTTQSTIHIRLKKHKEELETILNLPTTAIEMAATICQLFRTINHKENQQ